MRGVFVSLAALCLWMFLCIGTYAQSISISARGKGPQARSANELDAFGLLYEAKTSRKSADAVELFLRAWPNSEFAEYAGAIGMHSYHEIGNWVRSKRLAELVLKTNAENVDALLHLARLLIDPAHEEVSSLGEARRLADRGLIQLRSISIPKSAGSGEWLRTRNSFAAVGYSVVGWVCFREGEMDRALEYLQRAANWDAQGEYFYRLSLVTAAKRDWTNSQKWASQAIKAGPERISVLARRQLASLELRSDERP